MVAHEPNGIHSADLYIFDFKVDAIRDIGQPRAILSPSNGSCQEIISFSADGSKVAAGFSGSFSKTENHLVDLQKEEVLNTDYLDEDARDHSVWNTFVNVQ